MEITCLSQELYVFDLLNKPISCKLCDQIVALAKLSCQDQLVIELVPFRKSSSIGSHEQAQVIQEMSFSTKFPLRFCPFP